MATYNTILEIEAHANGGRHDIDRFLKAIEDLRHSSINTHAVQDVITTTNDEPMLVKHFGYDYKCKVACNHTLPPYGVKRYFGVSLVIQGYNRPEAFHFLFGTYKINDFARIDICSYTSPYTGERKELQKIKES